MRRRRGTGWWITSAVVVLATVAGAAFLWWPRPIQLAAERTGDANLLAAVGSPSGHRRLSVAVVEGGRVRHADIGASPDAPYEIGSLTKALTGLVLADAVRRGEVDLEEPVSRYLPELAGSAAGEVSLAELAGHRAGYPRLGTRTFWAGLLSNYTAGNPYTVDRAAVLAEARGVRLDGRGTYAYSNLGAAVVGQALAAATGTAYPDLMRARLFAPLGMPSTSVADHVVVPAGLTERGRRAEPWVMNGYAPAGGVVSTSDDLARLATALLAGRAPGQDALRPRAAAGETPGRQIGLFWQLSRAGDPAREITWHNGGTGGYATFLGIDRQRGRAVVVLSDTATSVDDLGVRLLTE